ncbi:MAG: HigA family addiction module antitoxin [Betaproteobacteria bacterium]|jgi:addiction module HigA family antidote
MKSLRDPNRRPTHPGAVLREDVLPALGMTQTEFAQRLGVSRLTVNDIVQEKRPLTAEMALKIGALLRTSAESWLRMQEAVTLWEARQSGAAQDVQPLDAKRLAA